MAAIRSMITTSVSRFLWVLAIAACDDTIKRTSLDGQISCGGHVCESGTICVTGIQHVDAALLVPTDDHCDFVTADCPIYDCDGGECPLCVRSRCADELTQYPLMNLSLRGRRLACPVE